MASAAPQRFRPSSPAAPPGMAGRADARREVARLWVLWSEPDDGTRRTVGELKRDAGGFAFSYGHEIDLAREHGFHLLPEFPELRDAASAYRSSHLFATFAQRIPSPKRADFIPLVDSWGVENVDNPLEVLAASGGIQMTDRVELAEYRSEDDDFSTPLDVRAAGMKHHPGKDHIAQGDDLLLVREPANQWDGHASFLLVRSGEKLGYVPRPYTKVVAKYLDAGGKLRATALRQLTFPADAGRWVVRLER